MGFFDKLFGKKESTSTSTPQTPVEDSQELMDDDQFWEIIALSKSRSKGDYDAQQEELRKELLKLEALDILKFGNRFRTYVGLAYTWEMWGAAYIMHGGCSDDCFSDFRGWLIGKGEETFLNALQDPETLTTLEYDEEDEWEGLSYVHFTTYEEKTGQRIPQGIIQNLEVTGQDWEEVGDDLKNMFPKLWAKWGF
ncbi:MAG: DUF4240 domain-containing protein [Saprospiraceae bacterium]